MHDDPHDETNEYSCEEACGLNAIIAACHHRAQMRDPHDDETKYWLGSDQTDRNKFKIYFIKE
jgi:hypothetical protein